MELPAGVAAVMAEGLVDFSVGPLALGDEDDGAAARDEGLMDVAERGLFGFDVFEDVEANDGIDGFAQVFGVEVGGDVAFAAEKASRISGQVSL